MKVRAFPADTHGCGAYRIEYPARVAAEEGADVDIFRGEFAHVKAPFGWVIGTTEPEVKGGQIGTRFTEMRQDVVVLNRPARRTTLQAIEAFQRRGSAVVVDVDDDGPALASTAPAASMLDPRVSPDINWKHTATACQMADLVTCTTPELAERYGAHGRVAVLPNCVPQAMLEMGRESDGRTLGWAGDVKGHVGDLEVAHGGVQAALEHAEGWRFHLVGVVQHAAKVLGLAVHPSETGWLSVEGYQQALGALDVGIVPLGLTRFNAAKSWLKGIEYAARGVPFVASPTPSYQRLAAEGIGVLAPERARNWKRELTQIMCDESLRFDMAARGRELVAAEHTYETQGWRWLEAWEAAIAHHKRGARRPIKTA